MLGQIRPFQQQLLKLPFEAVIDLDHHDLCSAVLRSSDQRFRFISSDSDLVSQSQRLPGEKDLIKLRGDLWLEDSAITLEDIRTRISKNPGLKRYLQKLISDGPLVLCGFAADDPILRIFKEMFDPLAGIHFCAHDSPIKLDSTLGIRRFSGDGCPRRELEENISPM